MRSKLGHDSENLSTDKRIAVKVTPQDKQALLRLEMDLSVSEKTLVTACCEHANKSSGSLSY